MIDTKLNQLKLQFIKGKSQNSDTIICQPQLQQTNAFVPSTKIR